MDLAFGLLFFIAIIVGIFKILAAFSPIIITILVIVVVSIICCAIHAAYNDTIPTNGSSIGYINIRDRNNCYRTELIKPLNRAIVFNLLAESVIVISFLFLVFLYFYWGIWAAITIFSIVMGLGIFLKIKAMTKCPVRFEYQQGSVEVSDFEKTMNAWKDLFKSKKVWRMVSETPVPNPKTNAGMPSLFKRANIKYTEKLPFYIKTNIPAFCLAFKGKKLIFLPDMIIIFANNSFYIADVKNMQTNVWEADFLETSSKPSDAVEVKQAWKYSNKNGSPDMRFNGNYTIPVCLYGFIELTYSNVLKLQLSCSNHEKINEFKRL